MYRMAGDCKPADTGCGHGGNNEDTDESENKKIVYSDAVMYGRISSGVRDDFEIG